MRRLWILGALLAGCGGGVMELGGQDETTWDQSWDIKPADPTGKKLGVIGSDVQARARNNRFGYQGGPLMTSGANVYYIWYGLWNGSPAQPILTDLAKTIGGSAYLNAVTAYADASGARIANDVRYGGAYSDTYSRGAALSDADVALVVSDAVTAGKLPADPNGVYFVLLTPDVNVTSGLCERFCAAHDTVSVNGATLKYAVVGNPDRCPSKCSPQSTGPNGHAAADAMAGLVAAQLVNAMTDPTFAGWFDRGGFEVADKCGWTFGDTYATSNGATANVKLGARDFLLHRIWTPTGAAGFGPSAGACVLSY